MIAAEAAGEGASRIVVCADDFALSEASDAVIIHLLEKGAINATTCLVEGEAWPRAAGRLRTAAQHRPDWAIGLHFNLTERLPGCRAPRVLASFPTQVARGLVGRPAWRDEVLSAMRSQWSTFVGAFGRAPDFIDGHEHAHLTPIAREALFRLIAENRFVGWVRQCKTSSTRWTWKRMVLDPLSASLTRRLDQKHLRHNPGFGGLRRFDPTEDIGRFWRTDLAAMTAGGVLVVHPGAKIPGDPIGLARAQEARLLAAGALAEVLDQLEIRLSAAPRNPWWDPAATGDVL